MWPIIFKTFKEEMINCPNKDCTNERVGTDFCSEKCRNEVYGLRRNGKWTVPEIQDQLKEWGKNAPKAHPLGQIKAIFDTE